MTPRAQHLNDLPGPRRRYRGWLMIVPAFLLWCGPRAEPRAMSAPREGVFGIGPSNVCAPLRRIVLVRKARETHGIRFDEAVADRENGSYRARITIISSEQGRWVERGSQRVEERPLRGWFHPFMVQTGKTRLRVGTFDLQFNGPSCVSMYPFGMAEADHGLEFAPTNWQRPDEINAADARLHWFRVDLNRSIDVRP